MKHIIKSFLGFFTIAVLLTSCMGSAYVDFSKTDEGTDFSKFDSYQFVEIDVDNRTALTPRLPVIESLKDAIRTELGRRGLTEKQGANLKINIGVVITEEMQTRETTYRDAQLAYAGQRNYQWEQGEVEIGEYNSGLAVLDFVDMEESKIVWQGGIRSSIVEKEDKMQERVQTGVKNLFKKFPIKPLK